MGSYRDKPSTQLVIRISLAHPQYHLIMIYLLVTMAMAYRKSSMKDPSKKSSIEPLVDVKKPLVSGNRGETIAATIRGACPDMSVDLNPMNYVNISTKKNLHEFTYWNKTSWSSYIIYKSFFAG